MSRYARPRRGTSTNDSRGSPPRACSARSTTSSTGRTAGRIPPLGASPAGRTRRRVRAGGSAGGLRRDRGPRGRHGLVWRAVRTVGTQRDLREGPEAAHAATVDVRESRSSSAWEPECLGAQRLGARAPASPPAIVFGRSAGPGDPVAVQRVSRRDRGGRGCTVRRSCGCGGTFDHRAAGLRRRAARCRRRRKAASRGRRWVRLGRRFEPSTADRSPRSVCRGPIASNRPSRTDRLEPSASGDMPAPASCGSRHQVSALPGFARLPRRIRYECRSDRGR